MTIQEAAQMTNCPPHTIFNYVKMGKLAATYNGKDFDICLDDLTSVLGIPKRTTQSRKAISSDETLEEMSSGVSDFDGYILSLTRQIQEADQQIEELYQIITKQRKYIQELTEQLHTSQQTIKEMKHRVPFWRRVFRRG